MRILISSAGRRVGLMRCFRESLNRLAGASRIVAADSSALAPALQFADRAYLVPRCDEATFLPKVLEICRREHIELIVPTVDPELGTYARSARTFDAIGAGLCLSSLETVELCDDKQLTNGWLRARGFPTTRQANLLELARPGGGWRFPLVVKPRRGSGSAGVRLLSCRQELDALASGLGQATDYIVEETAAGDEYTINAFVDAQGACRAAVPHRRLEVRGGEVSKAVTVRDPRLIDVARDIARTLPGARGPLSIQCFLSPSGSVCVTEINPRFGGGYPLTHRAGATFTCWLLQEHSGLPVNSNEEWVHGLTMLRYDREVFRRAVPFPSSRGRLATLTVPPASRRSPSSGSLRATAEA